VIDVLTRLTFLDENTVLIKRKGEVIWAKDYL
jgi:hypothetical protein